MLLSAFMALIAMINRIALACKEGDAAAEKKGKMDMYGTTDVYQINIGKLLVLNEIEGLVMPNKTDFDNMTMLHSMRRTWKLHATKVKAVHDHNGKKTTWEGNMTVIGYSQNNVWLIVSNNAKFTAVFTMAFPTFENICWNYNARNSIQVGTAPTTEYPIIRFNITAEKKIQAEVMLEKGGDWLIYAIPNTTLRVTAGNGVMLCIAPEGSISSVQCGEISHEYSNYLIRNINDYLDKTPRSSEVLTAMLKTK